jgi:hypothetical protein
MHEGGLVMDRKTCQVWLYLLVTMVFAPVVLAMNGCGSGSGSQALAAPDYRIETFIIEDNTFFLRSDTEPNIAVDDGTTTYTLNSSSTVSFTQLPSTDRSFTLRAGDIVIERPGSQTLTLVREI